MASALVGSLNLEAATPDEFSLRLYRKVLTVFYVEERMKAVARQGKFGRIGAFQ